MNQILRTVFLYSFIALPLWAATTQEETEHSLRLLASTMGCPQRSAAFQPLLDEHKRLSEKFKIPRVPNSLFVAVSCYMHQGADPAVWSSSYHKKLNIAFSVLAQLEKIQDEWPPLRSGNPHIPINTESPAWAVSFLINTFFNKVPAAAQLAIIPHIKRLFEHTHNNYTHILYSVHTAWQFYRKEENTMEDLIDMSIHIHSHLEAYGGYIHLLWETYNRFKGENWPAYEVPERLQHHLPIIPPHWFALNIGAASAA